MLRYGLLLYFVLYFATIFLWRSYVTWKQTGVNPYVWGQSDNAHDLIGRLFRLTLFACVIVVVLYTFTPVGYAYVVPIRWLQQPRWVGIGVLFLLVSFVWILVAQRQMGQSWRIGVDATHQTALIQTGVFRLSRNPVFLGMRLTLLGLFLTLPSAATLAIWLVGDVLMQIQVRLEEAFLTETHRELYTQYCQQTRRWL